MTCVELLCLFEFWLLTTIAFTFPLDVKRILACVDMFDSALRFSFGFCNPAENDRSLLGFKIGCGAM